MTIRDLQRAQQRPDTSVDIAERIAREAALVELRAEIERRWPSIDLSNVDEVLAFQAERLRALDRTVPR